MATPTDEELENLTLACQKLWDLDENRLINGEDYSINVQSGKKSYQTHDGASEALFSSVSKDVWRKPTYKAFYFLLDNYDYLVSKDLAPDDLYKFKCQLYQMWFQMYRREAENDSCGFEHVFVGESKGDDVTGLHSWIQFFIQEVKGHIDYKGFIKPREEFEWNGEVKPVTTMFVGTSPEFEFALYSLVFLMGEERTDVVIDNYEFEWKREVKPVTTMFVGTSPEFEFALYSLVFLMGEERTDVGIDKYEVCVRAYRIRSSYGDKIGTCFPELKAELDADHD
eukprot:gene2200-33757_t